MNKIIIIGCPGSGKSLLSFKLEKLFKFPTLHLDTIYHINNDVRITTKELVEKVDLFATSSSQWIIDGNYISTIEQRIKLADTIILLDIDTNLCISNALSRTKQGRRDDMAVGFDITKISQDFLDYINNFKQSTLPIIINLYEKYRMSKNFVILKSYDEIDKFYNNLVNNHHKNNNNQNDECQ